MKRLAAICILLALVSIEILDCTRLLLGNESGIELVESETDNSEKESESETHEKELDEKLVSFHTMVFNQSLLTQKMQLDKVLMTREVFRKIVSPPPELS